MHSAIYLNGRGGFVMDCCPHDGLFFLSDTKRKALDINADMDKVIDNVIKNIHEGEKNSKAQDRALVQDQYAKLRQAVKEGYGKLSFQVEYGGVNFRMSKNLQTNVAVFSAFKKHDMMRELVKNLRDEEGRLKDYQDFRKEALAMVGNYREKWLEIEYNSGVRQCRMASDWERFERDKRLYPNLKYMLSRSAHKREDHLSLVGTVLPMDHPFWNIYAPQNGWGCKCWLTNTDEHPTDEPAHPEIHEAFAFNPGKEGKVFNTEKHPYAQLPQKEYQAALKEAHGALCRYEAKEFMQSKGKDLQGQKIPVRISQKVEKVELIRDSFTHSLQTSDYFLERMNILTNIKTHLENAYWMYEEENRKPKKKFYVLKYHYLKVSGMNVVLVVEERRDGKFYLHMVKLTDKVQ